MKVGKTSFSANFKKNLLLATEIGYNAIDGIYAQPIEKWSDIKVVCKQLAAPEIKEKFDTITIDTVALAYDLCEKYICAQNSVQNIGDIPWGAGYSLVKKEFENTLRAITLMGYGLILITHSEKRIEKNGDSEEEFYSPSLNKRAYEVCNRLVDLIGYIGLEWNADGTSKRYLYTRQTPHVMAGSRYKYLEPKIEFGYQQLVDAIGDALDKAAELDGAVVLDHAETVIEEKMTYNEIKARALELWNQLVKPDTEELDAEMAKTILKKAEILFGRSIKLSEITEDQSDIYYLLLLEMEELASKK